MNKDIQDAINILERYMNLPYYHERFPLDTETRNIIAKLKQLNEGNYMKYKITLISYDSNVLEFRTEATSEEDAITNTYAHIEKLQWEHFGYQVKYIDIIDSIVEVF